MVLLRCPQTKNSRSRYVRYNIYPYYDTHLSLAQAGLVGIFYVATINLKERVFGAPAQTQVTSSLNVMLVLSIILINQTIC